MASQTYESKQYVQLSMHKLNCQNFKVPQLTYNCRVYMIHFSHGYAK